MKKHEYQATVELDPITITVKVDDPDNIEYAVEDYIRKHTGATCGIYVRDVTDIQQLD